MQSKVAEIIRKDPAIDYINSTVGPEAQPDHQYRPHVYRAEAAARAQRLLEPDHPTAAAGANSVPGVIVSFQNVQNINITGRATKAEFQYTLTSSDAETLYRVAPEMKSKLTELSGLRDVTSDLSIENPQMSVEIDREKAAVYGITVDQIRQELFNAFGSRQVGVIYTPLEDYKIILESKPNFQTDASALSRLFLKTASGATVPMEAVTRLIPTVGPLLVNRQANQPAVTLSFNLAPGYSLGAAVDAIQAIERDMRLPASVNTGFQGSAAVFQDSLKGQGILVLAAVFAAYVLLGILYESFIHPITIISGLPSAGVGALITLIAFRWTSP